MSPLRRSVALFAGALLLAACSSATSESSPATGPRATDAAATTTTSDAEAPDGPDATGGAPVSSTTNGSNADGVVASTAPSSGSATSTAGTAVPTTIGPALREALVAALPTAADLPAKWTLTDEPPGFVLQPGAGDFVGACGGGNADQRATASGVLAVVHGATYESPAGFQGFVSVYAFANPSAAADFVARTRSIGSCARSYSVREGSGMGEYDGFGDTSYDRVVRWAVAETTRTQTADPAPGGAAGTGAAVVVHREDALSTTADSKQYSVVETSVTYFEQYGRLVLVASLSSYCCTTGYRNPAGDARVTWDDLRSLLAPLRNRASGAAATLP